MANVTIEMPDDLVRRLEGIAARERTTVQQLALDQLRSFVETRPEPRPGSPAAVLRAAQAPPHLSAADLDELAAAIASARLIDPFSPTVV